MSLSDTFLSAFNRATSDGLDELLALYANNCVFIDPFHHLEGVHALRDYFTQMYANVTSCQFEKIRLIEQSNQFCLVWAMHLAHPKLAKGERYNVSGNSVVEYIDQKIIFHQDYYDAGEMLYEKLPLFGSAVRLIKSKVGQHEARK